ncbi:MAG: uncharacterized membrane protein YhaH (DUF805 family) [Alphaproteobacteria bacterium]|jgi:uncharacterized membrane protein YhaH (DUF805 family)
MNDLNKFLSWYLSERTRLTRGIFNIIFFVAFIPVLFIKMNTGVEMVTQQADKYKPLMDIAEQALEGVNGYDVYDVKGAMDKSQKTRDVTRQLMRDFGVGAPQKSTSEKGVGIADILNLVIFIALIPVVHMRLRDLGKWGNEMWLYTALVYSGIAADSLKSVLGISLPFVLTAVLGILTFILLSWLCMAKTKKTESTVNQDDTYMPGDNPNDPY